MKDTHAIPDIGQGQLDAVLRFLPIFTRSGYRYAELQTPEGQLPYYAYSDEVMEFLQVVYDQQIIFSFDWPQWQDEAERLCLNSQALDRADLLTLRKLLTTHVRKERFCEGHLAGMFERGHIVAVLRRLETLRDQLPLLQVSITKRNDEELPYLDTPLLNAIFDGVYGCDYETIADGAVRDFLMLLHTMQNYNYRYRLGMCIALFPVFEETVGPMERNSEGTTMWLALGLAIKDLYGMRQTTLRKVLQQVTIRK